MVILGRRLFARLLCLLSLAGMALPAAAGQLDPCQLLTQDEVSRALGTPANPGVVGGLSRRGSEIVGGQCSYRAANNPVTQVSISLDAYPGLDKAKSYDLSCRNATVKDMAGVGRGACAFVSPGGFVNLTVLADGALLRLTLSGRGIADPLAAVTELGRAAAGRQGSGAAVARVPGLEALLGTWTIHPPALSPRTTGSARAVINVRDKGNWSLREAEDRQGVMVARDGKFLLSAGDLRLEGTYKPDGDRVMVVDGLLKVRLDRMPCGQAPWLVDPDLLRRFGGPARTLVPKATPDPAWAGLWQGPGYLGGRAVTVLLYVLATGEARLMLVYDREGRLSAEDGRLVYEPNLERRVEGRYTVHDPDTLEVTLPSGTAVWKRRPYGAQPRPAALRGPCGDPKFK
ncbi:MAG: hypothetical protein H6907_16240 [Hyphomicrobiales bacterium]|nr:hypothetical protein [Hyphomicrobiales bacterium]MCP5373276.1 hypothetical protein [Hyphomicrobiales bacterium]